MSGMSGLCRAYVGISAEIFLEAPRSLLAQTCMGLPVWNTFFGVGLGLVGETGSLVCRSVANKAWPAHRLAHRIPGHVWLEGF